jgi:hypothetical protein
MFARPAKSRALSVVSVDACLALGRQQALHGFSLAVRAVQRAVDR